jgi:tetratricopeptide (TPR) repeat protein
MHYKILLLVIIAIVWAFFYLHNANPATIDFTLDPGHIYTVPVTYLVIAGFFAGVVLSVANSLVVDIRRAVKDLKAMRERRRRDATEKNYRRGITELFKDRPSKARSYFMKALDANPTDVDVYLRLADAYIAEGDFNQALSTLDDGLGKRPESEEMLLRKAEALKASGDPGAASRVLARVLELDSSNAYAMERLRDLKAEASEWGETRELQKKIISMHKGARSAEESAADERLFLGYAHEEALAFLNDGSYERVFDLAREMTKRDERFLPGHMLMGEAHMAEGSSDAAIRTWEAGYETTRDPVFLLKIEEACLKASDPQKILDDYKDAIERSPGDRDLGVLRARLYLRLEMIDDAIAELERISSDEEENSYVDVLLGEAYMKRGLSDQAAKAFKKALRHDKDVPAPPFECSSCARPAPEWAGRCRHCGEWGSVKFKRAGAVEASTPIAGSTAGTEAAAL